VGFDDFTGSTAARAASAEVASSDNASEDPKCHADDIKRAETSAGDGAGAGEQGHGGAARPTRHKARRRAKPQMVNWLTVPPVPRTLR